MAASMPAIHGARRLYIAANTVCRRIGAISPFAGTAKCSRNEVPNSMVTGNKRARISRPNADAGQGSNFSASSASCGAPLTMKSDSTRQMLS